MMYSSTTLGEMVVDGMIRYELKKVFSKSINRILILILVLVAFVFSCLAIWSVTYVDGNGNSVSLTHRQAMKMVKKFYPCK